jgi:hypothetical protein
MRKYLLIIALFLCASASAQEVKDNLFLSRNKGVVGAFGYNGCGWRFDRVDGMTVMLNIYGVHLDYSFNGEGNNEGNTGIDIYYGYRTHAFHVGYSIPICDWFKVTPVIGYNNWQEGYYDGLDYTVDGNGIHNKFTATSYVRGFDFGLVLSAEIAKILVLYVNVERYNIGVGAGISFRTDSPWLPQQKRAGH